MIRHMDFPQRKIKNYLPPFCSISRSSLHFKSVLFSLMPTVFSITQVFKIGDVLDRRLKESHLGIVVKITIR